MGVIPSTFVHVDLDRCRTFLPAWQQDPNHPKLQSTVEATQIEAGLIAQIAALKCSADGVSFLFDATFRNAKWNLEFIRRVFRTSSNRDIQVCIILVDTDLRICQERANARAQTSGRPVRPERVKDYNEQAKKSAYAARDFVDLFVHIKNDAAELEFIDDGDTLVLLEDFLSVVTPPPAMTAVRSGFSASLTFGMGHTSSRASNASAMTQSAASSRSEMSHTRSWASNSSAMTRNLSSLSQFTNFEESNSMVPVRGGQLDAVHPTTKRTQMAEDIDGSVTSW